MSRLPEEFWMQNGGDVRAAASVLAKAQSPGAVLGIEMERKSLKQARDEGLAREREAELLWSAWETAIANLPPAAVARRASWSRFEFVLEGTRETLGAVGSRLLTELKRAPDLSTLDWHLVFTALFIAEPERTFSCDPGYDLRTAQGRSAVAWVEPYSGADWNESQHYPTVTFLSLGSQLSSA